ncbi:ParH-like protein [Kitasatospora sp. NPDC101176]|uniref:ParH-like protein n=1 Tax=Kitasatospora sp. NPDC101176 TaxID=3364099 RepID=UPI0037FBA1BC
MWDDRCYRVALRRCRRVAERLELPSPFDATVLLERLARRRGRPISLLPVAARAGTPCGLLVSTRETDYILYTADTSALHRRHILVHEIAHLLLEHAGSAPLGPVSALLPHLSPALVQRVLGRTCYDEPQEREAELLASLILSRASEADAAHPPGPDAAPRAGGLDLLDALDALLTGAPAVRPPADTDPGTGTAAAPEPAAGTAPSPGTAPAAAPGAEPSPGAGLRPRAGSAGATPRTGRP